MGLNASRLGLASYWSLFCALTLCLPFPALAPRGRGSREGSVQTFPGLPEAILTWPGL